MLEHEELAQAIAAAYHVSIETARHFAWWILWSDT